MKTASLTLLGLVCLLVSLGWMIVWVVLPMAVFKVNWNPHLAKMFKPSYGDQGVSLFLLTFPVMLVAVLGSIYLHIKAKKPSSLIKRSSSYRAITILRQPLLTMGPLGIVTTTELIFVVMGVAFVCWHFGNYYYVSVKHPFKQGRIENVKPWIKQFRSVALRLGYAANISWAFVFFPVIRLSSILPLIGLTYESGIKYHIWIGNVLMITSVLHGLGFIVFWAIINKLYELLDWSDNHPPNIAGELAWVFLLAIWFTSFAYTRRKAFELFFYTHQLYALATIFYCMHIGAYWTCQILPGIFLFALDRYLRFLQSRSRARLISARLLPGGTVEMNFAKSPGLRYDVASSIFVNVPKFSKIQWHPFSVSSNHNMEPDKLSIAFKCEGNWSKKIYEELVSSPDRLEVSVEGPYGPASTSFLQHDSLVLISGGSGITPFVSIIREIIYQSTIIKRGQVPRVLLVCTFKRAVDLSMLELLLPVGSTSVDLSNTQIEIQAYVTRENQPPTVDSDTIVQTKCFKPSALDSPITGVLGPNSWLYLALITAASFILFLVLLALVTHYHIHPTVHKTRKRYNFTFWVLWDLFIMCVSIIVVSSFFFLQQKKKLTAENQKIRSVELELATSVTSPGSWFHNPNTDPESVPHQSLVQATKVHYGVRPNLQEILSEHIGEDIGVMASGPRALRQNVAEICSRSSGKKLHFETLSFTW